MSGAPFCSSGFKVQVDSSQSQAKIAITSSVVTETLLRSRPGKPNQKKGQNEKFMNFTHFL